ncbi:MAG: hypothetical protein IT365_12845 [Candidatus Hydrogenedentes bacterium]|nr:hypothetical protein [Candidatus Hydrogenedentota bacterium]
MFCSSTFRGIICFFACVFIVFAGEERRVESFDGDSIPDNLFERHTRAKLVEHAGSRALEVHFERVDWPNVYFKAPPELWDWSSYEGLAVDLFNPSDEAVNVATRIDNAGADGTNNCVVGQTTVLPGQTAVLHTPFGPKRAGPFWGMRGIPIAGPLGGSMRIDPSTVTAFQVYLPRPIAPATLIIDDFRLYKEIEIGEKQVPFPFIDRFGQYKHETWPGKLCDEAEFVERIRGEDCALTAAPLLPERDAYGGWAAGPRREATGWFRTEQIDGKWWLVTPDGHLFLSMGMDCVDAGNPTFVEQRERWFDWLPASDDPLFGSMYQDVSGAHSMAEVVGGEGRVFDFYAANLARKYGPDWAAQWRETTRRRLHAWGFNTIGVWSQEDAVKQCGMPYVASSGLMGGFRRIEGGGGYWAKMPDVYDPGFARAVEAGIAPEARKHGANRLCIGLFADNEMAWEAIRAGTLASPVDQPCRVAQIEVLKQKYETIGALNVAWETNASDWDSLRVPSKANARCNGDLEDFVYAFAHRYFSQVRDAIKRESPHLLYLGCRFSIAPETVVRACSDVADVVSFSLYYPYIGRDFRLGKQAADKPVLIGEFHFGAMDRGMFHMGLVGAANQEERANCYERYVHSVVDHPAFVGCHWFQYVDHPVTGRWYDGENFNIGFVNVVDSPYPEMVEAAKAVHAEMYMRRYRGSQKDATTEAKLNKRL